MNSIRTKLLVACLPVLSGALGCMSAGAQSVYSSPPQQQQQTQSTQQSIYENVGQLEPMDRSLQPASTAGAYHYTSPRSSGQIRKDYDTATDALVQARDVVVDRLRTNP